MVLLNTYCRENNQHRDKKRLRMLLLKLLHQDPRPPRRSGLKEEIRISLIMQYSWMHNNINKLMHKSQSWAH